MKNLTTEEFDKAPPLVQFLHMVAISGISIGSSIVNKAMTDHPEYFEDELERKRKWDLVPNEVHSAYNKELSVTLLRINILSDNYACRFWSKGIEISKEEKMKEIGKEIYKKHYEKYGL